MTDSPITIPFPRPDGEARLEWIETASPECQPDGGFVRIEDIAYPRCFAFNANNAELLRAGLAEFCDPSPILLAAEKLRNEKRRLAEDGSELRCHAQFHREIARLTLPTLEGYSVAWSVGPVSKHTLTRGSEPYGLDGQRAAIVSWHRTAYLHLLKSDEAYPPGELPRKLKDDEVRFPDGSAGRMEHKGDLLFVHRADGKGYDVWVPRLAYNGDHVSNVPGQLARLRTFFAAGPPVELAEDECLINSKRYTMGIVGGELHLLFQGKYGPYTYDGARLRKLASTYPDPLGWPRALAYFEKHVAKAAQPMQWMRKRCGHVSGWSGRVCPECGDDDGTCVPLAEPKPAPEPARVTDVRWADDGDAPRALFMFDGIGRYYAGKWNRDFDKRLHPSDIALIERCWAEGRLGEREVLFDSGKVGGIFDCAGPLGARQYRIDTGEQALLITAQMLESDQVQRWSDIGIDDPTQRARVRAIVAGMQKEKADAHRRRDAGGAQGSDHGDQPAQRAAERAGARGDANGPGTVRRGNDGHGETSGPGAGMGGAGDTEAASPILPEVTPSGEVKAPTCPDCLSGGGRAYKDGFDRIGHWCHCENGQRRKQEEQLRHLTELLTSLPKEQVHTALSDHIRRGDATKRKSPAYGQHWYDIRDIGTLGIHFDEERGGWEVETLKETDAGNGDVNQETRSLFFIESRPAPDLTELREAWNSYMPGLAPLPDRVLPILLAVERLVK